MSSPLGAPSWAVVPDGRHVSDLAPAELRSLVGLLGLDVSSCATHDELLGKYVASVRPIYDRGGDAGIQTWFAVAEQF